jgi:perosamine synthetase
MSLMALNIGPGDEVIVPDLTFVATANAVSWVGATPVLADIDRETLGLDPAALEQAITPQTQAVIPVWFNGRAPNLTAIEAIVRDHGLAMVEDAACALGSRYQGRHAGTFGHTGCISFNTTKIITTGTGGIVLTDDHLIYEKIERLKNHGRLDRQDYHPIIGFNFGFSDLLAALGLAQMHKLPGRVSWKRELFDWYYERLANVPGIDLLPLENGTSLWYPDIFVTNSLALKEFLESRGLQTRLYFPPVHTQPCYQTTGDFTVAESVSQRGIWLPTAPYLTEAQVEQVCQAILEWIGEPEF